MDSQTTPANVYLQLSI
jgi:26S proteasome regulatory subunit T6